MYLHYVLGVMLLASALHFLVLAAVEQKHDHYLTRLLTGLVQAGAGAAMVWMATN